MARATARFGLSGRSTCVASTRTRSRGRANGERARGAARLADAVNGGRAGHVAHGYPRALSRRHKSRPRPTEEPLVEAVDRAERIPARQHAGARQPIDEALSWPLRIASSGDDGSACDAGTARPRSIPSARRDRSACPGRRARFPAPSLGVQDTRAGDGALRVRVERRSQGTDGARIRRQSDS